MIKKILAVIGLNLALVTPVKAAPVTISMLSNCTFGATTTSASSRCLSGSGLQRVVFYYHANFCNCQLFGYGPWVGLGQWSTKTCTDCYMQGYTRQFSG